MSPTELTALIAAVAAVLSSVVVPLYLRRQAARQAAAGGAVVSWQSITSVLQAERDDLRAELRTADEEHRRKVREMVADCDAQLTAAKARISHLEVEVADLYKRLVNVTRDPGQSR